MQISANGLGPFGRPWIINDTVYYTEQAGELEHALSINRLDGTATYMTLYSSREGHFKLLYPGVCKKLDKSLL